MRLSEYFTAQPMETLQKAKGSQAVRGQWLQAYEMR